MSEHLVYKWVRKPRRYHLRVVTVKDYAKGRVDVYEDKYRTRCRAILWAWWWRIFWTDPVQSITITKVDE